MSVFFYLLCIVYIPKPRVANNLSSLRQQISYLFLKLEDARKNRSKFHQILYFFVATIGRERMRVSKLRHESRAICRISKSCIGHHNGVGPSEKLSIVIES